MWQILRNDYTRPTKFVWQIMRNDYTRPTKLTLIFTARKRSLGQGNVLHMSIILSTGVRGLGLGGLYPGGLCPGQGGLCEGGLCERGWRPPPLTGGTHPTRMFFFLIIPSCFVF